jgi:hypothetical protein
MIELKDKKFSRLKMIEFYNQTHNVSLTAKLFSTSLKDFLDKAYTYQLFFNIVRPNTYKENKTP